MPITTGISGQTWRPPPLPPVKRVITPTVKPARPPVATRGGGRPPQPSSGGVLPGIVNPVLGATIPRMGPGPAPTMLPDIDPLSGMPTGTASAYRPLTTTTQGPQYANAAAAMRAALWMRAHPGDILQAATMGPGGATVSAGGYVPATASGFQHLAYVPATGSTLQGQPGGVPRGKPRPWTPTPTAPTPELFTQGNLDVWSARYTAQAMATGQFPRQISANVAGYMNWQTQGFANVGDWLTSMGYVETSPGVYTRYDPQPQTGGYAGGGGGGGGGGTSYTRGASALGLINWRIGF